MASHYSIFLRILDRLTGNVDELLTDKGIRLARMQAWKRAIDIWNAESDEQRSGLIAELDTHATKMSQAITPKTRIPSWLFNPFRRTDRFLASLF